jgi:nicotinate-nucleotide--dimethylbenzimidazole phosphoribosyltransferase
MEFTREQLASHLAEITPVDQHFISEAQDRLDHLTKPPGSLGRLEECARQVAGICRTLTPDMSRKTIITFAGDHGVVAEGVSTVPAEVTPQMVANFLAGGAGVNVLARHVGAEVRVVDVGVAVPVAGDGLISARVRAGTDNIRIGPAMSEAEALAAIQVGILVARDAIKDGTGLLGTGDMGIGNTTPSAALFAAFLGFKPEEITGRGTGITDDVLAHKIQVITDALAVNKDRCTTPLATLAAVGGLEIAGICGMILEAARTKIPVVVDGFISSAGALCAMQMNPFVMEYCFFSHMSAEQGHRLFFEKTGVEPLLHLGLRLGEGTGAALAMSVIESGVKIMTEMATFAEAGVSEG